LPDTILDANGNRRLDRGEAFDSATVTVDTSATVILWAFVHDTTPPRLREVDPVDSLAFRLIFSEPLDPTYPPDTTGVRLFALPDTTPVALEGVWTSARYDSLAALARAVADSLRRAHDTTGHRVDTAAVTPRAGQRGASRKPATPGAIRSDTSRVHQRLQQLLQQRPVLSDRFVARTVKPLTPGARYIVRAHGVRNLTGRAGEGQQVFEVPARPVPRDTTGAKSKPKPKPKG
jgi:hypothetical protein